ncbi:protein of unknown function [Kyrpidia spormannii]|uniref:Uncharacterized protein n=2 Tax=Kyrpidia spormannii TaxID=2055160 RepID=A0ACA8Z6Q0_9BACL|nr:protein of unknown function [Kyrpidia spormannii]CAB3390348.1 protein of unknown function [Kyrpidia spormannii]
MSEWGARGIPAGLGALIAFASWRILPSNAFVWTHMRGLDYVRGREGSTRYWFREGPGISAVMW